MSALCLFCDEKGIRETVFGVCTDCIHRLILQERDRRTKPAKKLNVAEISFEQPDAPFLTPATDTGERRTQTLAIMAAVIWSGGTSEMDYERAGKTAEQILKAVEGRGR